MLDKQFDPKQSEVEARQAWSEQDFMPQGDGQPYCIMLPPPNVTGTLHMGHGFQHTLMDALIRYHRMCGDKTLWQPGTDHAGIATQMVVEKQLARENLDRKTIGREAFEKRVWQWKEQSGNTIVNQMKKLGVSCDWSRQRFTMDEGLSKAVTTAFVKLYQDGLIYRGTRLVNWDPVLQTALSDLEVLSEEEQGSMWHIRYPLLGEKGYLVVATTRPETLFGDVAVAVNPNDARYSHLVGKKIQLPLTDREILIIADDYVDVEFGTGCVKITPAHDFNDFEVGRRHHLSSINVFSKDAKLNEQVPEKYRGLSREEARKQVVADLRAQDLIEKIDPHKLQVPRSERSGAVVEPYLTEQWYVKMQALAEPALAVVESDEIQFVPETWKNTYRQWLSNIQDWCVSRQLWWGHRIPAWYDEAGNVYVANNAQEAMAQAGHKSLKQDEDVLDTWFSSGLWPFSTLGWPDKTPEFETFYPTNVLVTGFDIIFFWVARMIMFGLYFTGKIPFKQVLFTGLIRDHEGQKMSKSKGNVLDPIDIVQGISLEELVAKRTSGLMLESQAKSIEKNTRKQFPNGIAAFGEDALRFTFCALATHGRDVRFDLARTEGSRNFCNKLWNATRFIQMQLEKCEVNNLPAGMPLFTDCALPEQWLIAKLNEVSTACAKHFAEYRFDLLAQCLYEFTWYEYCDWYIEFAKIRLNEKIDHTILQVLVNALDTILRLLHPIMPFITEDLWQNAVKPVLNLSGKALMLEAYPSIQRLDNQSAVKTIDKLKEVVICARQIRTTYQIGKTILAKAYLQEATPSGVLEKLVQDQTAMNLIQALAKIEKLEIANANQEFDKTYGRALSDSGLMVLVPLEGIVDFAAEQAKAAKEIAKLELELAELNKRLENPKAPETILAKWHERVAEINGMLVQLKNI